MRGKLKFSSINIFSFNTTAGETNTEKGIYRRGMKKRGCGVGGVGEHRGVDTIQFISQRSFGWK